jgi:hypothetical protein
MSIALTGISGAAEADSEHYGNQTSTALTGISGAAAAAREHYKGTLQRLHINALSNI